MRVIKHRQDDPCNIFLFMIFVRSFYVITVVVMDISELSVKDIINPEALNKESYRFITTIRYEQEIAKASAKVGKTAEMLPSVISSEREKILAALTKEQGEMGHLAKNFGEAFGEGSKMADATSAMLKTYESVLQEIRKTPPNGHEDDPPFRIKDYEESAAKIEKMAERLTVLIQTIEPLLAPQNTGRLTLIIDRAIEQAETRSRSLIHHTFWQGLLFILLGSLIIAVVFLFTTRVYRRQLSASTRHQ